MRLINRSAVHYGVADFDRNDKKERVILAPLQRLVGDVDLVAHTSPYVEYEELIADVEPSTPG